MGSRTQTTAQEFFISKDDLMGATDLLFHHLLDEDEKAFFKDAPPLFGEVMEEVGWVVHYSPVGDVTKLVWPEGRWFEQAEKSLHTIARYVAPKSFIAFEVDGETGFQFSFDKYAATRHDNENLSIAWTHPLHVGHLFRRTARSLLGTHGLSRDELHKIVDEMVAREVIAS